MLWRLPQAHLTCIDTFEGGLDHEGTDTVPEGLETVFDRNVRLVDASRVRKLVGRSRHRLGELVDEEAQFELIYVDGSHLGLDVLIDAAYAWQLLAPGGFLVFDDYSWAELGDSPLLRPRPAIDAFLNTRPRHLRANPLWIQARGEKARLTSKSRRERAPTPRLASPLR